MLVFKRLTALAVTIRCAVLAGGGAALAGLGQPSPWQLGFQQSATPVMDNIIWFHDYLLYIITAITLFVLALLLIIIVRFNARQSGAVAHHPQHAARNRLDGDPGRHPGGDRGARRSGCCSCSSTCRRPTSR